MELESYRTIKDGAAAKLTRKGSRFIALAWPVTSLEEVQEHLDKIKRRYHDAAHHCHAYRLITKGGIVAHADDAGEPARSAGPPILRVLKGEDLSNILIIVVRYFGGTRLGIGGLIRAYGDATKEVLAQAKVVTQVRKERLRIRYPPELTGEVLRLVNRYQAKVEGFSYAGQPVLTAMLTVSLTEEFRRELSEVTSGRVEFLKAKGIESAG